MIAITGANGLLGNFIVRKFVSENLPVVALKRATSNTGFLNDLTNKIEWREADVTNSLTLADALKGVDTVIHAAAIVSFDPRQKEKIFETNVVGTHNVVNACLALGVKRLIFVSSVAALGRNKLQVEIDEENKWVESDLNSDYAKSKYLAELEVYRGKEEGLTISIINPSVILAPANADKSSAQLFKYVVSEKRFYSDAAINYVDARDVADIIFKVYNNSSGGEKFVASAGVVDLKDLLSRIALRLNKKAPSIKISRKLIGVAARLEELRCRLTGKETLISRQSVKMSAEKFHYLNSKSIRQLDMKYRPLEETLNWCCEYYKNAFTTNKQD
jgi:nucleoside-diphosphate-sugar epimerase